MSIIRVIEKPDTVSFDDIHEILYSAHEMNRKEGFTIKTSLLNAEELKHHLGKDGKCFVAMDGDKPAGTMSYRPEQRSLWCVKDGRPIYEIALIGVLPEYKGQHIHSLLYDRVRQELENKGSGYLEIRAADNNKIIQQIYRKHGFEFVDFHAASKDHYSLVMLKWPDDVVCPKGKVKTRYLMKKAYIKLRFKPGYKKRFGFSRKSKKEKKLIKKIQNACAEYKEESLPISMDELKKDMRREYEIREALPEEYARYHLESKTEDERKQYVFTTERKRIFTDGNRNSFPKDKYERFKLFEWMYHRDVLQITFSDDPGEKQAYQAFIKKHDTFFAKPAKGTKGKGVMKLNAVETADLSSLFEHMKGSCILEEEIVQGRETAAFHPSSINTLRLASILSDDGKAHCLFALFRTGQGNSVVDNVGSGGIVAAVDTESGILISDGLCGTKWYPDHPDTKIVFKGYQLPKWKEVCSKAIQAHERLPQQSLIGWDFAWTKDGCWEIVEANPSPSFDSIQYILGKGIRPDLEKILGTL